jgi:hypothetical protein
MSNFSYLFICNPTYRTQTRITNRLRTINSKTHILVVMIDELKAMSNNQIIFTIIFYACACNSQAGLGPKHYICLLHEYENLCSCLHKCVFILKKSMYN